jgi:L-2-hydroxyglutarate oxidase LhgO
MVQKCNQLGIELFSGKQVNVTENLKLFVGDEEIKYRHFVNCAGVNSPGIARKFGLANEYALVPFVGLYNYVPSARIPLRTLVYPVPHEVNPFLGVHFTLTTNGEVKIGPTAIPALGHEQYKLFSKLKLNEVTESLFGLYSITKGDKHSLRQMMVSEIPKIFLKTLVRDASKLVPSAMEVKEWKTKPPGIRAQLVDKNNGNLVQDFIIESGLDSTHLLNTVSPGWTTALPFSEYIVREYVLPNL